MDKQQAADAVIERVKKSPTHALSDMDAAHLMAAPKRTLLMEKLLGLYHFNKQELGEALQSARRVFKVQESSENAKNLALLMMWTGQLEQAIAFMKKHQPLFEPITYNGVMAMLYTRTGNKKVTAEYGTETLRLKDAAVPSANPISPRINKYDPENRNRNVISFSLWGRNPRYLDGARNNAIVARYLYPGWTPRFYVDESVPQDFRDSLRQERADVVIAPKEMPADKYGLFWRFLVEDDPQIHVYAVRDADSVVNIKERAAVEDWLASGKAFHVMRDRPAHSELILAGMWGAHRGNIGDMRGRIDAHLNNRAWILNDKITDQSFLGQAIWPIVRQHALVHDAWLSHGNTIQFRDEFKMPEDYHIGQNDAWHRRTELKR